MRVYGGLILVAILTLSFLGGCGSDDTAAPEAPARAPVLFQITDNNDFEGNPTYSPDGNWILFESDATGNMDIYKVNAAGGPSTAC